MELLSPLHLLILLISAVTVFAAPFAAGFFLAATWNYGNRRNREARGLGPWQISFAPSVLVPFSQLTQGLRPFGKLRAGSGVHSFAASRLTISVNRCKTPDFAIDDLIPSPSFIMLLIES
jgi:hypothetical protein